MDGTVSTSAGSLVGSMPLELLGAIFTLCLPAVNAVQPSITRVSKEAARAYQLQPFQLAAVSRQWRFASLHWPRAWSHIEIYSDNDEETIKSTASMLDVVLSRSANTWLTIRVSRAILAWPSHRQRATAKLLSKHMARCRTVYFDFAKVWKSDDMLSILQVPTPQLRDAYLWSDETVRDRHLPLFLRNAPLLKNLAWSTPFICRVSPLPSLRHMELIAARITSERTKLTPILKACSNLVQLEISFPTIRTIAAGLGQVTRVRCSALKYLIIRTGIKTCDMISFWSHVDAPELQKLTTYGALKQCSERLAFIRHALTVERPEKLTRIAIGELAMTEPCLEQLKSLFQDIAQVESLCIFGTKFDREGLAAFCAALLPPAIVGEEAPILTSITTWPLPALKRIYLRNCGFSDDCNLTLLVTCVRARVEAASQQQSDRVPTLLHYAEFHNIEIRLGVEIEGIIASQWETQASETAPVGTSRQLTI